MKLSKVIAIIGFLFAVAMGVNFAEVGIVNSGTISIELPKSGAQTVTFNDAYAVEPGFGFGLIGFEMPAARKYNLIHTSLVNNTQAKITWTISSVLYKLKYRWLASNSKVLTVIPITLKNPSDNKTVSVWLGSKLPTFVNVETIRIALMISSFNYDTGSNTQRHLYLSNRYTLFQ